MKSFRFQFSPGIALAVICSSVWAQPEALKIEKITVAPELRLTIQSAVGTTNVIEYADELAAHPWRALAILVVTHTPYEYVDLSAPLSSQRFYRVGLTNIPPAGMALIPTGSFTMGDVLNEGRIIEFPTHRVQISAFYMDQNEVTKALWDGVYSWAVTNGYEFDNPGSWFAEVDYSKGPDHPVCLVNWYDVVKWCNARSEKEGRVPAYYTDNAQTAVYRTGQVAVEQNWVKWDVGYRLPTEAEWEYAARGGLSTNRFPWGDTIAHNQANYWSYWSWQGMPVYAFDQNPTEGYHPAYDNPPRPYTSPVGSFPANGYGLFDLAGNVWEWCWDWYGPYSSSPQSDPRGPTSGPCRVFRGGCWADDADACRVAYRSSSCDSIYVFQHMGFRSVLPPSH